MKIPIKMKNTLFIIIGSAIFSFGVVNFNMANNLTEGGFTGITLLLYFLFSWDPAIMNLVLNIPVFIVGWRLLGVSTFIYTVIGTVMVSVFLWVFQIFPYGFSLQNDMTLAALFAGSFIGVGLGIIFRYGGTTGGVDIIARLVNKYVGWGMGRTMFLFDAVVIVASVILYLNEIEGMYTLVAVFIAARVIDFMVDGAYAARGALIVSEHQNAIASKILKDMDRGVTLLHGSGSYTGEDKRVIYCVVGRNEIIRLKNLINEIDPHAFVSMMTVHDVLGEGFTLDENKNPIDS